jgi:hypothetical protein
MSAWKAFCETVHLGALGIWAGFLGATAAFAANTFPIMKGLDPLLPGYAKYPADHWKIAAGSVAQRGFLISDIVTFICAILSVGTLGCLIGLHKLPRRRPATVVRACSLGLALACAAGSIIIVSPQLNAAIRLKWAAAAAGDVAAVAKHSEAVDLLHPISSKLLFGTLVFVLAALFVGLWGTCKAWAGAAAQESQRQSPYEAPALLGGRRV